MNELLNYLSDLEKEADETLYDKWMVEGALWAIGMIKDWLATRKADSDYQSIRPKVLHKLRQLADEDGVKYLGIMENYMAHLREEAQSKERPVEELPKLGECIDYLNGQSEYALGLLNREEETHGP